MHFTLLVEKISICTTGVSKESLRSHIERGTKKSQLGLYRRRKANKRLCREKKPVCALTDEEKPVSLVSGEKKPVAYLDEKFELPTFRARKNSILFAKILLRTCIDK